MEPAQIGLTNRGLRIAIIRQGSRCDGGGERIVDRMRGILTHHGHDVTLISRSPQNDGAKVLVCDPPARTRTDRERRFAQKALAIAAQHEFDVVQSHERIPGCTVYRAGDGVHASWLEQRRRVMHPLASAFLAFQPYHRYVMKAERRMFEHPGLKAVICNSRMVEREILNRFTIARDKLHIVYNGVDTKRFSPDLKTFRAAVRLHFAVPSNSPLFVFVGSGWERKGLAGAIRAVAANPQASLLVVGRDKAQRFYERLAAKLRATDRVHFAGVQTDVGPYLGAADAFILPALYDPFPNAVLEAMAAGLPVVTSTTCGAAEVIHDGIHGFVCDALDQASLADAVRSLSDFDRAATMGRHARLVVESFTVERMERELTQLYRRLLDRPAMSTCQRNAA